ncbi:MAG TPA: sodium:solute symporter [Longimicrobiales bacterium]
MEAFTTLDVIVLVAYVTGVTALGVWLGGRQKSARDYFLADRGIPWWAVCFSVVATETSALTFISVPATAYTGDFWFLQLAFGYLIGRIGIAVVLLPGYFRGELSTAYALLEERFGAPTRRFASTIFLVTRALADSVRIFAAAIPIALITGLPYAASILITGVFTLIYTYYGGLRAVVWVDVVQMFLYLFGGAAALVILRDLVPGGFGGIAAAASDAGKFRILHPGGGFADARWILTGLVGGAFLSMASHGVDHLIVQRLLAAPSLRGARKALIGSGIVVIGQFALFLLVGAGLFAFYGGRSFATPDEIFPRFIVEQLPPGVSGLIVAGILAAAMSTVASSLNSLASATTHDLYAPLAGRAGDDAHLMRVGKRFTLLWAAILVGGAILFQFASQGTPVVVIALQIASFTYGGLLGGFLLGVLSRRARQSDAILGMATAIAIMAALWATQQFGAIPKVVDTLWFALIGSIITVAVGGARARAGAGAGEYPRGGAVEGRTARRGAGAGGERPGAGAGTFTFTGSGSGSADEGAAATTRTRTEDDQGTAPSSPSPSPSPSPSLGQGPGGGA